MLSFIWFKKIRGPLWRTWSITQGSSPPPPPPAESSDPPSFTEHDHTTLDTAAIATKTSKKSRQPSHYFHKMLNYYFLPPHCTIIFMSWMTAFIIYFQWLALVHVDVRLWTHACMNAHMYTNCTNPSLGFFPHSHFFLPKPRLVMNHFKVTSVTDPGFGQGGPQLWSSRKIRNLGLRI